jgi:hypothetical protein
MKRALIIASCLLVAAWASPAGAVSPTEQQVQALQAQVDALAAQVNTLQSQQGQISSLIAQVNTLQTQLAPIKANPVLALGPYVAVDPNPENGLAGPHVIFYGANLHIVSGSGQTVHDRARQSGDRLRRGLEQRRDHRREPDRLAQSGGRPATYVHRQRRDCRGQHELYQLRLRHGDRRRMQRGRRYEHPISGSL